MSWPHVSAGWRRSLGSISEAVSYDIPSCQPVKNVDGNFSSLMNLAVTSTETVIVLSSLHLGSSDKTIHSAVGGTTSRFSKWTSTTSLIAKPVFGTYLSCSISLLCSLFLEISTALQYCTFSPDFFFCLPVRILFYASICSYCRDSCWFCF